MWHNAAMTSAMVLQRWAKDELLLLERDPAIHGRLAPLIAQLANKPDDRGLIDKIDVFMSQGLAAIPTPETRLTAARYIWTRLKDQAPAGHAAQVEDLLGQMLTDPWAVVYLKKLFKVLAVKQGWKEFVESSYVVEP